MLDAMAIRQQLVMDRHTGNIAGYVDIGTGSEEEDLAKEVLVVMVVGLKARWKAPIAFYFSRTLSAEMQTSLLKMNLEKLVECGMVVHAVTMDGHASNLGMCRLLGCCMDVNNLRPWFCQPGQPQKIWIIMDGCHMIKLLRNSLEALQEIQTPNGFVKWCHLDVLNRLQNTIGLRLANKLSDRHLNFHQQKMKVPKLQANKLCKL
jgi:hypothetical protein